MARFRGQDLGYYYLRELPDGRLVWAAEFDQNTDAFDAIDFDDGFVPRRFANIFFGRRESGGTFAGDYFDVPKGLARGNGDLSVRRSGGRFQIDGAYRTTLEPEAGSAWADWVSGAAPTQPRFQGTGTADFTGTWMCDDGGTYYLRHVGNRIVWFGENAARRFANVFDGTLSGTTLRGSWADVPKFPGGAASSGTLALSIPTLARAPSVLEILADQGTMRRSARTGGFGGSRWRKVNFSNIEARLSSLTLGRTERSGEEPYLWVIWAKVDGDTVDILDPGSAALTLGPNSGHQNNVTRREDVRAGTRLPIPPSYGSFRTRLSTFRNLNPSHDLLRVASPPTAVLALFVAAWEEDATSQRVASGIFRDVRDVTVRAVSEDLRRALRASFPTVRDLNAVVTRALGENAWRIFRNAVNRSASSYNIGGLFDSDDHLGHETITRNLGDLQGRVVPIDVTLGRYRLRGSISAS